MVDKLTPADRTDAKKCAARFAAGLFRHAETAPWIHDGKIQLTEGMLAHVLTEVYAIALDAGRAVERDALGKVG